MSNNRDNGRVPDLLVEQLALGELSEQRAEQIRRRLELEPGGLERLADLERSNQQVLKTYPAAQMAASIRKRSEEPSKTPRRLLLWLAPAAAAAAAAAALLVILAPPDQPPIPGTTQDQLRLKGGPLLTIQRRGTTGAKLLRGGSEVRTGDQLSITYTAGDARHGVILSVDGRAEVTLHFPDSPGKSTRLVPGAAQHLAFAYELDDAPGFERFFFVTSAEPIDVKVILETARRLGNDPQSPLPLPAGCASRELLLKKVQP